MVTFLGVLGLVTIAVGIIVGVCAGSILGFVSAFSVSVVAAVIFFVLMKLLANQETILNELDDLGQNVKTPLKVLTCPHCAKTYTEDFSYCPYCGRKADSAE